MSTNVNNLWDWEQAFPCQFLVKILNAKYVIKNSTWGAPKVGGPRYWVPAVTPWIGPCWLVITSDFPKQENVCYFKIKSTHDACHLKICKKIYQSSGPDSGGYSRYSVPGPPNFRAPQVDFLWQGKACSQSQRLFTW